jgi:F-type H+-transporting ATPase subunit gamma
MAGAGLIAIKRRIKSVTNTKKITKAMGLVATAKLRKARERLAVNNQYYAAANEVIEDIYASTEGGSVYLRQNKSSKKLYVVFSSETGLCGSFNVSVINKAVESMSGDRENSFVMVVGQKGKSYFNRLRFDTLAEYVEVPDIPTIREASMIANHMMDLYEKGEVGEVNLVYTKFISAVKQNVIIEKVLPFTIESNRSFEDTVVMEPTADEMIDEAIKSFMRGKISNCLIHSKSSEFSSRMTAMDGATKNANELLEKLNLKYNRVRQGAITQEISEIVGGAEAQK